MIIYKRGIIEDAKKSGISPAQARRIKSALSIIQNTPVDKLTKLDRVKKLRVENLDNVYVYRVDMRNRIVLSIDTKQGKPIVQSVLDSEKIHG